MKSALKRLSSPIVSRLLTGRSLTVVCYHRVLDDVETGLFPDVGSTDPKTFEAHLDMMGADHRFVGEDDVVSWLRDGKALPERPLLLTFDDGYHDSYDTVYPILAGRGIPASFFVTTGHIDTGELLWWDLASAMFFDSEETEANLPLIGRHPLPEADDRLELSRNWVMAAKQVPDAVRREALGQLADALDVTPRSPNAEVSMTWDQMREMAEAGMSIGGHTESHPILARMDPAEAKRDIAGGLDRIHDELGREVLSFAYPNGQRGDFDAATKTAVSELGIVIAFSLLSGPATLREVARDPLAVRRIYVGANDDPQRLALKLLGWSRVSDLKSRVVGG